jgi:hypothetical protein
MFCPLDERQLFVVDADNSKMKLYAMGKAATGGAGCLDMTVDITSQLKGVDHFVVDGIQLVNAVNKIRNDDVDVSIEKNKVVLKNPKEGRNFISLTTLIRRSDDEIKEQEAFIDDKLALPEFTASIDYILNDANRDVITTFSDMTKLLEVGDTIAVGPESIKTADNVCVASYKIDKNSIVSEETLLPRDVSQVLKLATTMKFDADQKYLYIDFSSLGIRFIMQPKLPKWQYPSDDELREISPADDKRIKLAVKTSDLYATLSQFEGIFMSSQWRYGQSKFLTNKAGLIQDREIKLHFDDTNAEVCEYLKVAGADILEIESDEFEFMCPFLHVRQLESIISQSDTVTIEYNDLDQSEAYGMAIKLYTDKLHCVIAKLIE